MTPAGIDRHLKAIEDAAERGDHEAAASLERNLWRLVLDATADGEPGAATLATLALQSLNVRFKR